MKYGGQEAGERWRAGTHGIPAFLGVLGTRRPSQRPRPRMRDEDRARASFRQPRCAACVQPRTKVSAQQWTAPRLHIRLPADLRPCDTEPVSQAMRMEVLLDRPGQRNASGLDRGHFSQAGRGIALTLHQRSSGLAVVVFCEVVAKKKKKSSRVVFCEISVAQNVLVAYLVEGNVFGLVSFNRYFWTSYL